MTLVYPVREIVGSVEVTVPKLAAVTGAALDGAADTRPKPNADTATSAMRLRSVFVDICFLSISQDQEFPDIGLGD
jgi:hypothetical protein